MSSIRLSGTSSGYYDLTVPAAAGTNSIDLSNLPVKDSNGRLGIGTNSPAHLLDVIVSSGSASARFGTTHNTGDNDATVIISNGGSGDGMLRFDYEGSNTDRARIGVTSSGQDKSFILLVITNA